jgi:hypothetical protein
MNKIIFSAIILIVFSSCEKPVVSKPVNLIEREKMVNIMYDLTILESMKVEQYTLLDSIKYTPNQYIYKKYKIDSVQFAKSNLYYAADYKDYEKIYNEIKTRLVAEKTATKASIKQKSAKEILKLKAKKKLLKNKIADSIKKSKEILHLKNKTE